MLDLTQFAVDVTPIINAIIELACAVIICIITGYIVPILKNKKYFKDNEIVDEIISMLTTAAEQSFKGQLGEIKFDYVYDLACSELDKLGIKYDSDSLEAKIESVVGRMNGVWYNDIVPILENECVISHDEIEGEEFKANTSTNSDVGKDK